MKKYFLLSVLVVVASLLLYSCATILHGTDQEVSVSSTPDNATVSFTTFGGVKVMEGTTPFIANLDREDEYRVLVSKEGYEDNEVIIKNSTSIEVWGNILCGGIIGLIIDFSNGAAYDLEPETIHVDLVEVTSSNDKKEFYLIIKMSDEKGEIQTVIKPFIEKQNI